MHTAVFTTRATIQTRVRIGKRCRFVIKFCLTVLFTSEQRKLGHPNAIYSVGVSGNIRFSRPL